MEAKINRHIRDFREDFTIEFNVKFPPNMANISEEDLEFEWSTGHFTNDYALACFEKIKKVCRSKRWSLSDWSFAGRSAGWFALLCNGDSDTVTETQLGKIEQIVESFYKNYGNALCAHYSL